MSWEELEKVVVVEKVGLVPGDGGGELSCMSGTAKPIRILTPCLQADFPLWLGFLLSLTIGVQKYD